MDAPTINLESASTVLRYNTDGSYLFKALDVLRSKNLGRKALTLANVPGINGERGILHITKYLMTFDGIF